MESAHICRQTFIFIYVDINIYTSRYISIYCYNPENAII